MAVRLAVAESDLGRQHLLGTGGYGSVFEVPDLVLPDVPGPLVFKKFTKHPVEPAEATRLKEIIAWRADLPVPRRRVLDGLASWPVRSVVNANKKVVGVLAPRADDRFYYTFVPGAAGKPPERRPVTLGTLVTAAAKWQLEGIPVPNDDDLVPRLVAVARIARLLTVLHRGGIVYGDLSYENVFVDYSTPAPGVLLIDCDGAYPSGLSTPNRQKGTPLWDSPEEAPADARLTVQTDLYKLALVMLRVTAYGGKTAQFRRPEQASTILPAAGVELLRRGLGKDPLARTTAAEWYDYLRNEIDARTSPPRILRCETTHRCTVEGGAFDVIIETVGADSAVVRTPDGREVPVPVDPGPHRIRMTGHVAGAYEVGATNSWGSAVDSTPIVSIIHPPRLEVVRVEEPAIPTLGLDSLIVLRRGLEAAEATAAQLATPLDQLRRFERQSRVYDELFAPLARLRESLRPPAWHSTGPDPFRFTAEAGGLRTPVGGPPVRQRIPEEQT